MFKMFKVSKIVSMLLLLNLLIAIVSAEENDDVSVCSMETKKGLVQLKEKYKNQIKNWKELQIRGCKSKTDTTEANEGLDVCILKKFEAMENTKLKTAYLETFDKCLKKIAPIKDLCNESEQKERVYCFVVESRNKFSELCEDYIKDQVNQRKLFALAYECVDERLKKKGV